MESPSPEPITPIELAALSPGERVTRDGAFTSRRGAGLRPPKGYGRSRRTIRFGPQAGEGSLVRNELLGLNL